MVTEPDLAEYLDEIRKQVCACCVERPPGGPPCAPLGKQCGVELHLPQLIDAIHEVHSPLIEPYLNHNRQEICQHCPFLHSSICPCPMDYLAIPLVQAVETVDERRGRRDKARQLVSSLPGSGETALGEIGQLFTAAAGRWTGCDWPTRFGRTGLDLNGCPASEAEAMAVDTVGREEAKDWEAAAGWLARIERLSEQAEAQAALAVTAANAGEWEEAVDHARRACAIEFASGRAIHRATRLTWGPLCRAIEAASALAEKIDPA
jgi:hypothetical protein